MNNSEDLLSICHFLSTQHILTLCASYNADIWCANCFYMFDQQSMALYVMTESTTRHVALMQMNSQVVGTIANQPRNIKLIKGIQYRGDIVMLTGEAEKLARQRYSQRFPVAKVATTPIWQLQLLEIKMTNNALGFAKKLYWMR